MLLFRPARKETILGRGGCVVLLAEKWVERGLETDPTDDYDKCGVGVCCCCCWRPNRHSKALKNGFKLTEEI